MNVVSSRMDGERVKRGRRGSGVGVGRRRHRRGDGRSRSRLAARRGGHHVAPHAGRAGRPQPAARPPRARQPLQLSHTPQHYATQGGYQSPTH